LRFDFTTSWAKSQGPGEVLFFDLQEVCAGDPGRQHFLLFLRNPADAGGKEAEQESTPKRHWIGI
jgi:hypothetical protein